VFDSTTRNSKYHLMFFIPANRTSFVIDAMQRPQVEERREQCQVEGERRRIGGDERGIGENERNKINVVTQKTSRTTRPERWPDQHNGASTSLGGFSFPEVK
jgi:hypothetical protein